MSQKAWQKRAYARRYLSVPIAASDKDAIAFSLSSGEAGDAPEGRNLLETMCEAVRITYLLMDRAYEGDETRTLAFELGYNPVVPPKSSINCVIRLNVSLVESRDFAEFSLAMTS